MKLYDFCEVINWKSKLLLTVVDENWRNPVELETSAKSCPQEYENYEVCSIQQNGEDRYILMVRKPAGPEIWYVNVSGAIVQIWLVCGDVCYIMDETEFEALTGLEITGGVIEKLFRGLKMNVERFHTLRRFFGKPIDMEKLEKDRATHENPDGWTIIEKYM